jgi:SAM-dependent methyltransferase
MKPASRIAKDVAKGAISAFQSVALAGSGRVECNVCGWTGRRFLSDAWHAYIICPKCRSGLRQRLALAALQFTDDFSIAKIIDGNAVLHFSPESWVGQKIRRRCSRYATADLYRQDCDFQIDMSSMPVIADQSFDIVIAFDVLEHVPDYKAALMEVYRILSEAGMAIITVPQKDFLAVTYEDPSVVTPEARAQHYGVADHLRIFGDDFPAIVAAQGFSVAEVSAASFPDAIRSRHVLAPQIPSKNPLATNLRKVFFCRKVLMT